MKVWWLDYHPAFNNMNLVNIDDYNKVEELFKVPRQLKNEWETLDVILDDKGKPSDFLNRIGGSLVVSNKTKQVLSEVLNMNVEFLPLDSQCNYFILNVLTVLDCVDPNNTKEKRFASSGRLTGYEEFSLYKEVVEGHDMFRIKLHEGDMVLSEIYVSDKIKKIVEQQLDGYQLVEIWDSDFSWKEKEQKYDLMCKEIDKTLQETFDFSQAIKYGVCKINCVNSPIYLLD